MNYFDSCICNSNSYDSNMSKKEITKLSEKKEVIMNHFWDKGALFVRELRELYPEPKPPISIRSPHSHHLLTRPLRPRQCPGLHLHHQQIPVK